MRAGKVFAVGLAAAITICCGTFGARAAGADKVTLSSIGTIPASRQSGAGNYYTIPGTLKAGGVINLNFAVGVSGSGTTGTTYPVTMHFTAWTLQGAHMSVSIDGLSACTLAGRSSTCNKSATITVPEAAGTYRVKLIADDGRIGPDKMEEDSFILNFTVAGPGGHPPAAATP